MTMRRAVLFSDEQIPYEIDAVTDLFPRFLGDFRPDILCRLGDMLDMEALQNWACKAPDAVDWEEIRQEITRANLILDAQDGRIPKSCQKHFWYGNHEERLRLFKSKHPEWTKRNISSLPYLASDLRLKQRGYTAHAQMQLHAFGKLYAWHGDNFSTDYCRKNLIDLGVSAVCGHVHSPQRHTIVSRIDSNPRSAWGLGCLCSRNPTWKNGAPNRWAHGFGVAYIRQNGDFNLYPIDIVKGSFVSPDGRLYH